MCDGFCETDFFHTITVCRFAMGGIFTTELSAEHENSPIANVLLGVVFISFLLLVCRH
jgi:hypothetical protein